MSDRALRVLEHVHGHLGWLAAAALVHPVVVLRTPGRRALLATSLATALVTLAGTLGVVLYPDYRGRLKQAIFIEAPAMGWQFERKEHLAAGAIALSWAGLAAHLASRGQTDEAARAALWRASRSAYAASAALAILTGVLGVIVATYRTF
jgi:hypothetical protein